MADIITIKSARDDNRVALWERHPDHPGGEIFVAGAREVKAAKTRLVNIALKNGEVVEIGAKKSSGKSSSD